MKLCWVGDFIGMRPHLRQTSEHQLSRIERTNATYKIEVSIPKSYEPVQAPYPAESWCSVDRSSLICARYEADDEILVGGTTRELETDYKTEDTESAKRLSETLK
jgi:hypothetical protein